MRRPVLIRQPRHSSPRSGQWSSSQFGGRHLGSDESILQLRFWVSSGSLTPPQPIPACRLRMLSLVMFLTACLPLASAKSGASDGESGGTRATRPTRKEGGIRGRRKGARRLLFARRPEFRRSASRRSPKKAVFGARACTRYLSIRTSAESSHLVSLSLSKSRVLHRHSDALAAKGLADRLLYADAMRREVERWDRRWPRTMAHAGALAADSAFEGRYLLERGTAL